VATTGADLVRQSYVRWALEAISKLAEDYTRYEDYYVGDHKLEFATDKWKEIFQNEFEQFADNWCQVVIDAPVQRLEITGWRSEEDKQDAADAEEIWDDNVMEIEADDLHTQAFVKGDAYLMVWRNPDDPDKVDMYYNDAVDMAVVYSGTDRRVIARAAKRYTDDDGQIWLCLYFPDRRKVDYSEGRFSYADVVRDERLGRDARGLQTRPDDSERIRSCARVPLQKPGLRAHPWRQ
jgi:hypothetical protein